MPSRKTLQPKPVRNSFVQMTELVLPSHTNPLGTIFGGQIMAWIDIAASIAASRHSRVICVTASIDSLSFIAPAKIGDHVSIKACVNFTGRTSMEVGVKVDREDPRTGDQAHIATAYLTFVALGKDGKPMPIPPVVPETNDEKRRFKAAQMRREARLKMKEKIQESAKL